MGETDKKYKLTRQLLKLAIDTAGYRNEDIAVKAGLSGKSVALVSAWRNGRKNATERQMAYFIKEYGHLLKRAREHLFYTVLLEDGESKSLFRKLTGEMIFKYQVKTVKSSAYHRSKEPYNKNHRSFTCLRLVILQDNDVFNVICQYRAGLVGLIETEIEGKKRTIFNGVELDDVVHSDNEEGNWYCYDIKRDIELDELVQFIQDYCRNIVVGKNLIDAAYNRSPDTSAFFDSGTVYPLELSFYQKMLSLNLHSEYFPF
ncbi:hypothetical protein AB6D20_004025 [Vibrio splendidus]|uniref:hypothetical protein n=1 Tax=Vibrio TaxID=662 RepID=UPI0015FF8DD2|nr:MULTISPECIES: hypothetical protein [Vibrio]MBB1463100.1 hypothetical protein [Vibrio sp. SG41-7]MDH5897755.1 hypothetical protein [Vibrio splendidus]